MTFEEYLLEFYDEKTWDYYFLMVRWTCNGDTDTDIEEIISWHRHLLGLYDTNYLLFCGSVE